MKRWMIGAGLLFIFLGTAGCSNNKTTDSQTRTLETKNQTTEKKESSEKSSSTIQSSQTTAESSSDQPTAVWDTNKATALQQFMENWGESMGQSYQAYQPGNSVDFYGLKLPDGILGPNKNQPMAVNDTIVSAEWSQNGTSSADYSIVASYSDAESAPYAGKHVYFFAIYQQQPVVLMSMQNQEMPDGAFHFKATDNQDLAAGFQQLFEGQIPELSAKPQTKWTSMEEAIQFYEATYRNTANEISQHILWENYDRKCWNLVEHNGNRIVLHWSNISGAGGSYNEFVKNDTTTDLIFYDGNTSYPDRPSRKYTVQNSDHKVIAEEELWNK
ncbi:hypothetical protein NRIC_27750 [Enterococcus florum]|uniref:DUF4767 domain-containing protein n=1 Tax=Enterococcus florum TaxID=2480627 RepID=A0A4P5PE56_9ENTE|nr:DUF4767 domain-containing protein [Enterococcus florum]GCF94884.1 hypothetical protein NRIC_27750 [Enterococcus florum]